VTVVLMVRAQQPASLATGLDPHHPKGLHKTTATPQGDDTVTPRPDMPVASDRPRNADACVGGRHRAREGEPLAWQVPR
jgi:hypothetical protein